MQYESNVVNHKQLFLLNLWVTVCGLPLLPGSINPCVDEGCAEVFAQDLLGHQLSSPRVGRATCARPDRVIDRVTY